MMTPKLYVSVFIFSILETNIWSVSGAEEDSKLTQEQFAKLENIHTNPNELIEMGDQFAQQGEYHNALPFYRKAIKREPIRALYYKQRGTCYLKLEELDLAMDDFREAINKESLENAPVFDYSELTQTGKLYSKKGRVADACWFYTKTVERKLKGNSYCLRGLCLAESGQLDEALSNFKEAISEVNPFGEAEAVEAPLHEHCESELVYVGDRFFEIEKFREALWFYGEAIKTTRSPSYFGKRANCYAKLKNTYMAIDDYKAALSMSPNSQEIRYNFLKMMFSYTDEIAQQAIEEMRKSSVASAVLSKVAEKLYRDYSESSTDNSSEESDKYCYIDWTCSQAISKNSDNAECYEVRGLSNGKLGNYTMAISDLEKASELDPSLRERNAEYISQLRIRRQAHAPRKTVEY